MKLRRVLKEGSAQIRDEKIQAGKAAEKGLQGEEGMTEAEEGAVE